MNKLYAYAELPRAGLCNMLNVWARAFLWAKDNGAQMIEPQWVQLNRIGPILRGERDKRFYFGMFQSDYVSGLRKWFLLAFRKRAIHFEEGQRKDLLDFANRSVELREELFRIAAPDIQRRMKDIPESFIAVHIRRGDFKGIGQMLPGDYYVRALTLTMQRLPNVPVLVFSDGTVEELSFLKGLGKAYESLRFMPKAPALHDVLALSKATLLVGTNGSSFSEWSAFIGGMPTYWSGDEHVFQVDRRKFSSEVVFV